MDWITDEDLWSKKRTLRMFREWSEAAYSEMAWGLADEPLEVKGWAEANFETGPVTIVPHDLFGTRYMKD